MLTPKQLGELRQEQAAKLFVCCWLGLWTICVIVLVVLGLLGHLLDVDGVNWGIGTLFLTILPAGAIALSYYTVSTWRIHSGD